MATSGGQPGNKNATKTRAWAEAAMALDGDLAAIKEIVNRIDGRALASVHVEGEITYSDLTDQQLDQQLKDALGG